MSNQYSDVTTRFLRAEERLISSTQNELPLVIEAHENKDKAFLQSFLENNAEKILQDVTEYGAVLFRGFDIKSDKDFEDTLLKIKGLHGISEAFMSEQGRIHASNLNYVLYTNSIYQTGGTLYLGGFHTENYYSTDVPSYISFFCRTPSALGGETGLINMEKVYQDFDPALKQRLENNTFFVNQWLTSEISERYKISEKTIETIADYFNIPVHDNGIDKFLLMYKPNVFVHSRTHKKSLGINLFEIKTLNNQLRKVFMKDYQGKPWFWHRALWKLPALLLTVLEYFYILIASFFYSPGDSFKMLFAKLNAYQAARVDVSAYNKTRVGSCFSDTEVKQLAQSMRDNYSSCLWQKGDILLVDNQKIMHAGMPGKGKRLIRALICNPIAMSYAFSESGVLQCRERNTESVGYYMKKGGMDEIDNEAVANSREASLN